MGEVIASLFSRYTISNLQEPRGHCNNQAYKCLFCSNPRRAALTGSCKISTITASVMAAAFTSAGSCLDTWCKTQVLCHSILFGTSLVNALQCLTKGVLVPSSVVTDLGFPGDTFAAPIPIVPSCLSLKPHVCFLPYSVILWQVISYYESDWQWLPTVTFRDRVQFVNHGRPQNVGYCPQRVLFYTVRNRCKWLRQVRLK